MKRRNLTAMSDEEFFTQLAESFERAAQQATNEFIRASRLNDAAEIRAHLKEIKRNPER